MPVSKKCEQCKAVKRCRMFVEERVTMLTELTGAATKVPVYLCAPCARELGYG